MQFKKNKVYKILIVVFLILAVVCPFTFSSCEYSNDYEFVISSYKMDAVIDEYGNMHVVEKVTNDYSNQNTVFYKNLVYSKNNDFSNRYDTSSLQTDVRVKVESGYRVVFDTLTSGEMKFDTILGSDGKSYEVTEAEYPTLIDNLDREIRKNAFKSLMGGYGGKIRTMAQLYTNDIQYDIFYSKLSNFDSVKQSCLFICLPFACFPSGLECK